MNTSSNSPTSGIAKSMLLVVQTYRQNRSLTQLKVLLALSITGISLFLLIFQSFVSRLDGADAPECRMSYMAPAYARVNGFDQTHTRYASKYSLYLYREQGKDANPGGSDSTGFLTGVPVLFIPGNAGSYKQVRALAAECANLYVDEYHSNDNARLNPNARNLDFFAADFNEDFTAFHGRTLLDQAEYLNDAIRFIISLYKNHDNAPESVIVVAHSMGGIVARTMIALPNYVNNTINTFVTLAAPHAAAPVTFDGELMKVYSTVDDFWRYGFINEKHAKRYDEQTLKISQERLQNVSLVSITGGLMDTVLPADYTSVKGLVPETHGFNVFTTGIPGVWTPIDHLAIVWCDQLRKAVARVLLEVVDFSSPQRTYSLPQRMRIFRKNLLSGFEDCVAKDSEITRGKNAKFTVRLRVDNDQIVSAMPGERSLLMPPNYQSSVYKRGQRTPKMNFFHLPQDQSKDEYEFSALSSLPFANIEDFGKSTSPVALLCRSAELSGDVTSMTLVDFTNEATSKNIELSCIDVSSNAHAVPRSSKSTVSASESSLGGELSPYNVLQFNASTLSNFELVVIGESRNFYSLENSHDFIVADLVKSNLTQIKVASSFWKFLLFGVDVNLPAKRPLAVDVNFPAIWSSLVAYKLRVVRAFESSEDPENERFGPLIRQWISGIYETKWLVGSNNEPEKLITMHSVAPFVPFENTKIRNSLHLQVWSDSMSIRNLFTLKVQVDLLASLRLLVMRFRLVIGAMPVAIVGLVLSIQFWIYNKTGNFISFGDGLLRICKPKVLAAIAGTLAALSLISSSQFFQRLFYLIDPIGLQDANDRHLVLDNMGLNPFFLGLEEDVLCIFGPIFFVISLGLVYTVYILALGIAHIFTFLYLNIIHKMLFKTSKSHKITFSNDSILKSKRRLIGTLVIIGSIPFYFPYQFAYVVITIVQATVCVRSVIRSRLFEIPSSIALDKIGHRKDITNFKNFNISFLMIMLWILPINIPVLIVFIHNFALKWQTPFSSHHNFLAIVPIFAIIEKNVSGRLPPRTLSAACQIITALILGNSVLYSVVFGARHAWWLHYLLNFFCTWLWALDVYNTHGKDNSIIIHDSMKNKDPEKLKNKYCFKSTYLGMSPKVY